MGDISHYYEKLDRALKRLNIILVDDFEEIKKGSPVPTVALLRKLLFNTSTIVMKYMLLRGCPSHVPDKKVVISVFDLLRETVKYSPPISIDQFFSNSFAQHKIVLLTKVTEYVHHIDRTAGRNGAGRTTFVVQSEILQTLSLGSAFGEATEPEDGAPFSFSQTLAASSPSATAHHLFMSQPLPSPPPAVSPAHEQHRRTLSSPVASTTPGSKTSPRSGRQVTPNRGRSSPSKAMRVTSAAAPVDDSLDPPPPPPISPPQGDDHGHEHSHDSHEACDSDHSNGHNHSHDHSHSPQTQRRHHDHDHKVSHQPATAASVPKELIDRLVEERVAQQMQVAVAGMSEKFDNVINKLVAAVDSEFTSLNLRLKSLEELVSQLSAVQQPPATTQDQPQQEEPSQSTQQQASAVSSRSDKPKGGDHHDKHTSSRRRSGSHTEEQPAQQRQHHDALPTPAPDTVVEDSAQA